jgi:hypothetical protein
MTTMKMKKAREVAGVVVAALGLCTIGAAACQVDVISGDDGEGGQGGEGGASVVVVSTTVGTISATTSETTTIGSTGYSVNTGTGGCPPDPQWPGNCSGVAVGATTGGGNPGSCHWEQLDCELGPAFTIDCDGATGLCTCTGSGASCSCNWEFEEGACSAPCCGGEPGTWP